MPTRSGKEFLGKGLKRKDYEHFIPTTLVLAAAAVSSRPSSPSTASVQAEPVPTVKEMEQYVGEQIEKERNRPKRFKLSSTLNCIKAVADLIMPSVREYFKVLDGQMMKVTQAINDQEVDGKVTPIQNRITNRCNDLQNQINKLNDYNKINNDNVETFNTAIGNIMHNESAKDKKVDMMYDRVELLTQRVRELVAINNESVEKIRKLTIANNNSQENIRKMTAALMRADDKMRKLTAATNFLGAGLAPPTAGQEAGDKCLSLN